MHYFVYAKKDATIYSGSGVDIDAKSILQQNTGIDPILELQKQTKPNFSENITSRVLIQFDLTDFKTFIKNQIFPNFSSNVKYDLRLYEADSKELQTTDTIYAYAVSQSWDMGVGQRFDSPFNTDGVTWNYKDVSGSGNWTTPGGDVDTTYEESSMIASQSFEYGSQDIKMDVSNIVYEWIEQAYIDGGYVDESYSSQDYPNYGLLLRRNSAAENDDTNYGNLNFFSRETSTIYVPKLEVKRDDSIWSTGSLTELSDEDIVINVRNMQPNYKETSKDRIRVFGRERYPSRTFAKKHEGLNVKYLPSGSSYYSVKDAHTDEIIIDFDDYTKLSCDSNGNYFNFWFNGLQPERFYKFCFKVVQNKNTANENIRYFDNDDTFKVIR